MEKIIAWVVVVLAVGVLFYVAHTSHSAPLFLFAMLAGGAVFVVWAAEVVDARPGFAEELEEEQRRHAKRHITDETIGH